MAAKKKALVCDPTVVRSRLGRRDESGGHGAASRAPRSRDATGAVVAHISQNRRAWKGAARDWKPGTPEIMEQARVEGTREMR